MIEQYPSKYLERAVGEIAKLPGVGRKTALRLALHLLKQSDETSIALAESIVQLKQNVMYCHLCHNISDSQTCDICSNPLRERDTICVVENISGVLSIENTGQYKGLYHVLGGIISPIDGIGPAQLEMDSLVERVAKGGIKEVIFALNPDMEGDTTNYYISKKLEPYNILLTTLARGISVGNELDYTDEITLGRSIQNRVKL